ncbi:hypothetical protein MUK42_09608 [Musa troglodytarum]|uniref:LysM domain-containing protein n=1 Tax=Musa troglodytarum TaxID=320322 RepID=A0A9E7EED2_9LILI|nr:hypothetical protein MUK42_09608 [Musa troglodytarum]
MSKVVTRLLTILFILQLIFSTPVDARRPGKGSCDELYVAVEGETLQTIRVKCNDMFILDDNPRISDTDDIGQDTVLFIRQT